MQEAPRDVGQDPTDRPPARHASQGTAGGSAERQLSRRSLWFVSILGISALILGGIQLQRTLKDPFSLIRTQTNTAKPEEVALLELQAKDTDSDGISDYDELYSFNTSPYIADSDSDSVSDKDEVNRGTDPNCPEGKTCGALIANTNAAGNVNSETNVNTPAIGGSATGGNATQLRQALIASGVSKTELDAVDDATLLASYQTVLAEEAATNSNTSTANASNTNTAPATQLQTLTAPEIRQLLVANGVDANTLAGYDDATLIAVYEQALKESNSSTPAIGGSASGGNSNAQ
ncbi:MAG: hypothetical protein AAB424_04470 [Patescibacteria group bacterium]